MFSKRKKRDKPKIRANYILFTCQPNVSNIQFNVIIMPQLVTQAANIFLFQFAVLNTMDNNSTDFLSLIYSLRYIYLYALIFIFVIGIFITIYLLYKKEHCSYIKAQKIQK